MIEQVRAVEAFEAALLEDDAEQLYERAPCGYMSTTPDGVIVKVNETFLTWTGFAPEDLVGRRSFVDLLTAGGRIYHETHYAPLLSMHGAAREIALDLVKADGTRLPVLVNARLERGAEGAPRVVRIAIFDATERRGYERELLREKERAEASEVRARALAQTLQQTLIPPTPPRVPGLEIAAAYRPAGTGEEVGGDFYDVFQVAKDDWVVALGDVVGKGVEAAVVTALVRHTIRALAVHTTSTVEVLELLNGVLLQHPSERFCSVVLLRFRRDGGSWQVTMSSGGHPLPLLRTPGKPVTPIGEPGSLVGVFPTAQFRETAINLMPDDMLLIYTDGVTEARHGGGFYGDVRLTELLASTAGGVTEVTETLLADVLDFQLGLARDDIAVVTIQVPTETPTSEQV